MRVSLWICLVLLVTVAVVESAVVAGRVRPDVLASIPPLPSGWPTATRWPHLGGAVAALGCLLFGLDLALRGRGRTGEGLLVAAVVVLFPASPLLALDDGPRLLVAGLLLGLIGWFWHHRRRERGGIAAVLPRSRGGRGLVVLCTAVLVYLVVVQLGEMRRVVTQQTDFGTLYAAAAAVRAGQDPYVATAGGYLYPPTFAVLIRPLLWWPAAGASLVWFLAKTLAMAATLVKTDRLVQGGGVAGSRRPLFVLGLLLVGHRFWVTDLRYGNTNVVILALMTAALAWDLERRPARAGLAQALAVCTKVIPAVFVAYFLVRGRLKVAVWFVVAMIILNGGAALVMGAAAGPTWDAYAQRGVTAKLAERLDQPDNQSIWGALNRAMPTADLPAVRVVWGGLAALLGVAAVASAWLTRRRDDLGAAAAAGLFFLWGLLVSPGSWVVHYTMVLLPLAVLWRHLLATPRAATGWWVLFVAVNLVFTGSGWSRPSVHLSIHRSLFVWMAAALFVGLVVLARRLPWGVLAGVAEDTPPGRR